MSISKVRKHANGYYYVHFTVREKGKSRSKTHSLDTKDAEEAEILYADWIREFRAIKDELIAQGAQGRAVLHTVSELWGAYEKRHVSKENASPSGAIFTWKNLSVGFGHLKPAEITQEVVDDYEAKRAVGEIGRPSKAPTVRRELAILRACLNWCASPKRKLLDPALIPHFDLPPPGEPRDRWLKQDELQRLLTTAAKLRSDDGKLTRIERFLWLALETGARKAALLDLTWDRVDLETRVIHLNVPGRRQTKKRRSDVPISKSLLPILTQARDERENDLVLGNKGEVWAGVQVVASAAGFGSTEARTVIRDGEKKYLKRKATGISPHVLRHTAATNMARRGVALWIIAKVLGNSLEMVERVYAKHAPDDLRAAVDAISGDV